MCVGNHAADFKRFLSDAREPRQWLAFEHYIDFARAPLAEIVS